MADAPKRIQLRRTRGWRLPASAIACTRPGPWGNRYKVTPDRTPQEAVTLFRLHLAEHPELVAAAQARLRGHDLACYCALDAEWCHVDVWLEIANAPEVP